MSQRISQKQFKSYRWGAATIGEFRAKDGNLSIPLYVAPMADHGSQSRSSGDVGQIDHAGGVGGVARKFTHGSPASWLSPPC